MTAITIANLRIAPFTQKDTLKVVFGDTMELTFAIPHVDGESFMCGLDNERVVYPPSRPVCAYTNAFTRDGENVTFKLKLTTSKLRDYVSTLRKPMPVWLQIVRAVNGKYETVLLDDILALPSVIDGAMTVCEGDPLAELLEAKMDKPAIEGSNGQVLTMNADGHYVWADLPEIPEQQQADWEESDSTNVTYIKNKPQLAKVATSGSYNDLIDKPTIPEQKQANWNESDSTDPSYIENKPNLATVATSGSYNDLTDKPTIPELVQSDWDESDSTNDAFIKNKPTIPTVNDATVTINQGGVEKGTFTLNQSGNTTIDLNDGAQSDWDESDSTNASFIENKPEIPFDANDYLCFTCAPKNDYTISLNKSNASLPDLNMEWSKDKKNWTACAWSGTSGNEVHLDPSESVWYRGNNSSFSTGEMAYYWFRAKNHYSVGDFNGVYISGNIMSLLDKTCQLKTIPNNYCFTRLFYYRAGNANQNWLSAPKLPATELKAYCYSGMFRLADKLVEPPELPATNLSTRCYERMFEYCSSLSRAPKLPATELADGCYATMFDNCTSLKFVSVPFTTWNNNTNYWLYNVAANGVFECPSALVVTPRGFNSVPTGWTIVRIDAPNPDWDESDSTEASFIRNKPEIGASAQANWDESDSTEPSYIENKPDIGQMIADALVFHNN